MNIKNYSQILANNLGSQNKRHHGSNYSLAGLDLTFNGRTPLNSLSLNNLARHFGIDPNLIPVNDEFTFLPVKDMYRFSQSDDLTSTISNSFEEIDNSQNWSLQSSKALPTVSNPLWATKALKELSTSSSNRKTLKTPGPRSQGRNSRTKLLLHKRSKISKRSDQSTEDKTQAVTSTFDAVNVNTPSNHNDNDNYHFESNRVNSTNKVASEHQSCDPATEDDCTGTYDDKNINATVGTKRNALEMKKPETNQSWAVSTERRRQNNEAAKRWRQARKEKIEEAKDRKQFLEKDNMMLQSTLNVLQDELAKLHQMILAEDN